MKNKETPFCSPVTYDLVRWAVSQKSVDAVIRSIARFGTVLAHGVGEFCPPKNVNMQMIDGLTTVIALV